MRLSKLTEAMSQYNMSVGGNSDAWTDFAKDIRVIYGVHPFDKVADVLEVSSHTADFWTAVSKGQSSSYNPQTGKRK